MENAGIQQLARSTAHNKYPRWTLVFVVVGSVLMLAAAAGLVVLSLLQQDATAGLPVSYSMSVSPYRM